jgi:hypothetical protein
MRVFRLITGFTHKCGELHSYGTLVPIQERSGTGKSICVRLALSRRRGAVLGDRILAILGAGTGLGTVPT